MKITIALVSLLLFIGQSSLAGIPENKPASHATPPKSKADKKIMLQAHPQPNQDSMDAKGNHGNADIVNREWDGPLTAAVHESLGSHRIKTKESRAKVLINAVHSTGRCNTI